MKKHVSVAILNSLKGLKMETSLGVGIRNIIAKTQVVKQTDTETDKTVLRNVEHETCKLRPQQRLQIM